jgi:hypothetical protein
MRKADENPDAPVYWQEADVRKALKEAYEDITDLTEWYETTGRISLVAHQLYYDLNLLLTDVPPLHVTGAQNIQTKRWLRPVALRTLEGRYTHWQRVDGQPQFFFIRGLWMFGVWPRCPENAGFIDVYYTSMPPELTDSDEPGFPENFHRALSEYALYELFSQDAETKESLRHYGEYQKLAQALKLHVQERGFNRDKGYINV